MAKTISEYTQEELNEIARRVIAQRQKDAEKAKIVSQLWVGYKSGKIKLSK